MNGDSCDACAGHAIPDLHAWRGALHTIHDTHILICINTTLSIELWGGGISLCWAVVLLMTLVYSTNERMCVRYVARVRYTSTHINIIITLTLYTSIHALAFGAALRSVTYTSPTQYSTLPRLWLNYDWRTVLLITWYTHTHQHIERRPLPRMRLPWSLHCVWRHTQPDIIPIWHDTTRWRYVPTHRYTVITDLLRYMNVVYVTIHILTHVTIYRHTSYTTLRTRLRYYDNYWLQHY